MAEEKEILTILSKEEYEKLLARLIKELGKPKLVKRLSLQCTDYNWVDIDTRIRITDGKAEIMQKVGDYRKRIRNEMKIPLVSDAQTIFDMYTIFRNVIEGEIQVPIMQYENRLFITKDFEIKLTYQFGKEDAYNCEVEILDSDLNPEAVARSFDIPIHLPEDTVDFWKKWNERVNLDANKLSEEELLKLIGSYLNVNSKNQV